MKNPSFRLVSNVLTFLNSRSILLLHFIQLANGRELIEFRRNQMYKFFSVVIAILLAGCGKSPEPVPPQTKIFNEDGYKPMSELIEAVQYREADIMSDNEPEDVDWHGVPVKNICFVNLGEAWSYHKRDEITLVPMGSNGTYAVITPLSYDRTNIEVSSIYDISSDGIEDVESKHHYNVAVTIMYKFCSDNPED